jgi:hypothetical protein
MTNFSHSRKLDDWVDRDWNNKFNLRWYYSVGNISSELIPAVGWTLENLLTLFRGNRCSVFSHNFFKLQQKKEKKGFWRKEGLNHLGEKSELMTILKSQRYPAVSLLFWSIILWIWLCIGPLLFPIAKCKTRLDWCHNIHIVMFSNVCCCSEIKSLLYNFLYFS